MNAQKRYFLVLHGAQSPGEEARLALRTALSAVLQFETLELNRIFSALPSVLRNDLSKEEAERLMLSVESLDGDVEMLEQQDLFADDQKADSEPAETTTGSQSLFALAEPDDLTLSPEPPEPELSLREDLFEKEPNEEAEDLGLSLKLDDVSELIHESAPSSNLTSAEQAIKSSPRLFQLEGEDDPPAVIVEKPTTQGLLRQHEELFDTADPSDLTAPVLESHHNQAASAVESGEVSTADQASEAQSAVSEQEEDWRKVTVDWVPPQSAPLRKSNAANSVMWVASFLIAAATAYLLLAPATPPNQEPPYSVEKLLEEQQTLRGDRMAGAAAREPAAVAFDSKYYGEQRLDDLTVQLTIGHSINGFEISEVVAFSEEPPLPTKQEYMRGVRRRPWLRRFEAKRPVSVRKNTSSSVDLSDSISGRIVIQDEAGPHAFVATFRVAGRRIEGSPSLSGEWRLSNIELPEEFSDTFLIRKLQQGQFEIIGKGAFDLTLTPGNRVEAAASLDSSEPEPEATTAVE